MNDVECKEVVCRRVNRAFLELFHYNWNSTVVGQDSGAEGRLVGRRCQLRIGRRKIFYAYGTAMATVTVSLKSKRYKVAGSRACNGTTSPIYTTNDTLEDLKCAMHGNHDNHSIKQALD